MRNIIGLLFFSVSGLIEASEAAPMTSHGIVAEIMVGNNLDMPRVNEIVEMDNPFGDRRFIITDSDGNELPWQVTYDNKLIFPASVDAKSQSTYNVISGIPSRTDTLACGYFIPERLDDLAWENDRTAYRAYGPALQRKGERAFGYDVWTKSTSRPVVLKRYRDNSRGISFHKDHGDGMDVYSVGPTLGAGTAALIDSLGEIIYPYCFTDYEILDCGPLRFTVRLDYENEQRIISLDAGSYFNRTTVTYHIDDPVITIAPGIVIHHDDDAARIAETYSGHSIAGYADPTDNPAAGNGIIYIGTITPGENLPQYQKSGEAAHLLTKVCRADSGLPFTYYWGAGWSKAGIPDIDTWHRIMTSAAERLTTPLYAIITHMTH